VVVVVTSAKVAMLVSADVDAKVALVRAVVLGIAISMVVVLEGVGDEVVISVAVVPEDVDAEKVFVLAIIVDVAKSMLVVTEDVDAEKVFVLAIIVVLEGRSTPEQCSDTVVVRTFTDSRSATPSS